MRRLPLLSNRVPAMPNTRCNANPNASAKPKPKPKANANANANAKIPVLSSQSHQLAFCPLPDATGRQIIHVRFFAEFFGPKINHVTKTTTIFSIFSIFFCFLWNEYCELLRPSAAVDPLFIQILQEIKQKIARSVVNA